MANNTKVTMNKGGTHEKVVEISKIQIPDLFNFAIQFKKKNRDIGKAILELWSLAHDLKNHIQAS